MAKTSSRGTAALPPADSTAASVRPLSVLGKLLRIPQAVFGMAVIGAVAVCAVLAPWIAGHDPQEMNFDRLLAGLSAQYWLGTDQMGRDTLARLIFGARVALSVSVGAVGLGLIVGVPLGLLGVYLRGWVDAMIMRVMDALVVFPSLLLAVGLAAAMGNSLFTVIVAIGIANVPWMARIVRSQALAVREQDFVTASEAVGLGAWRIMVRHILPNSLAPVIVQSTLAMGYAVLTEAALGFIGVGIQPPTPTWGAMLQQAFPLLARQALPSIVPGVAIFLLVLAFNLLGDALRDVLDPRLKGVIH